MKRFVTPDHLAEAERRLAEGRSYIAAQLLNIQELKYAGQDTTKAEVILETLLESQELQETEHRNIVRGYHSR